MKLILSLCLAVLLMGCETTGSWPKFPAAEESLMKKCSELGQLPMDSTVTITQLMESVVNNYTLHHQCANKVEGWQKWYEEQKKAYEDAKAKSK